MKTIAPALLVGLAAVALATASPALLSSAPAPSTAAGTTSDAANTITVTVSGRAVASPSTLVVKAGVKASGDMGEEAITNFAQARLRAETALRELGFDGLEIEAGGVEFDYLPEPDDNNQNNMVFFPGSGIEPPTYGVTCQEELTVRFPLLEDPIATRTQVAEALDTAIDLGLKLQTTPQPNPYVYNPMGTTTDDPEATVGGTLSDADRASLELAAQTDAMENARRSAGNLAQLGGRTLGGVNRIAATSSNENWLGIGKGVELVTVLEVTFDLQ